MVEEVEELKSSRVEGFRLGSIKGGEPISPSTLLPVYTCLLLVLDFGLWCL